MSPQYFLLYFAYGLEMQINHTHNNNYFDLDCIIVYFNIFFTFNFVLNVQFEISSTNPLSQTLRIEQEGNELDCDCWLFTLLRLSRDNVEISTETRVCFPNIYSQNIFKCFVGGNLYYK